MKKILMILLAVCLMMSFVSCDIGDLFDDLDETSVDTEEDSKKNNKNDDKDDNKKKEETSDTVSPSNKPIPDVTVTEEVIEDNIGFYNFRGADFNILTRSATSYEHMGNTEGDVISQAVYKRNRAVSERFDVNINIIDITGDYDNKSDFVTALRAEHMSSTGAYDLVSTHSGYLGWLSSEGIITDLTTLPEIDFSTKFWGENLYNALNVDGSCYMMIGDIGHTLYEYMSVMFVNTDVLDEYNLVRGGLDGIYDMVDDGKWTWEQLYTLSENYGKGVEDGKYGLLFNTHAMYSAMISQDASVYTRNSSGRYEMESAASAHLVGAVKNLSKFFVRPNGYFANGWSTQATELNPIFMTGQALFYGQTLGESARLATMEDNFAVLPLPKYDEGQENYYTMCQDTVTAVAVMECTKDKEMSGVITQALALYGSQYVKAECYDKVLKHRYAIYAESVYMLNLIRAGLTVEAVPTLYSTSIYSTIFRDIVANGSDSGIETKYGDYVSRGNQELKNFYNIIDFLKS